MSQKRIAFPMLCSIELIILYDSIFFIFMFKRVVLKFLSYD